MKDLYLAKGEFYKGSIKSDLTGQKFNDLVVEEYYGTKVGAQCAYWICRCCCGRRKVICHSNLTCNRTRRCGFCQTPYKKGANNKNWKGCGGLSSAFFSHIKKHAEKRNLTFEISIQDAWDLFLSQNKKCALTGIDLDMAESKSKGNWFGTASLDRKDSKKGYTIDNIQWIHKDLNWMKNDFDNETFVDLCKRVANYHA